MIKDWTEILTGCHGQRMAEQQSSVQFEGRWSSGTKARIEAEAWMTQTICQVGRLSLFQWIFTAVLITARHHPRPAHASETPREII